jgi:phosphinothricin acetyltransferase
MAEVTIRAGESDDLFRLVEIYNHYVVNTHATFDTNELMPAQRTAWFAGFSIEGPHQLLVAEKGGHVIGYASSSKFKERPAYDRSVETTIYMAAEEHGAGNGHKLYAALIESLKAEPSVHRAYGVIALPNESSVAMHKTLGFALVGTCHEVGYKFDKYWDVGWFEKEMSH